MITRVVGASLAPLVVGSCGGDAQTIVPDSFTLWIEFSPGKRDLSPLLVGDQEVSSSDAMKAACFNVAEWKADRSLSPELIVGTNQRFAAAFVLVEEGAFLEEDVEAMEEYLIAEELGLDPPSVVPEPDVLREYVVSRDAKVAALDEAGDRRVVAFVTEKSNDGNDVIIRVVDLDDLVLSELNGLEEWVTPRYLDVTYRAIVMTTRVEIGDLREIVLIGGAGRRGKTCLGFRRDGTKVELGPAGGSIVPRSTHSFEDAINGWAASHSISITRGPGWR